MGADTNHRTRRALLEAVTARARAQLEIGLEEDKESNPFLTGVSSILDALKTGKIECRVYDKEKFHAKAYITHAKLKVVGAQALVGSSNFTKPGLTENIELNVQIQSNRKVAQLQDWFDRIGLRRVTSQLRLLKQLRGMCGYTLRLMSIQKRFKSSSAIMS